MGPNREMDLCREFFQKSTDLAKALQPLTAILLMESLSESTIRGPAEAFFLSKIDDRQVLKDISDLETLQKEIPSAQGCGELLSNLRSHIECLETERLSERLSDILDELDTLHNYSQGKVLSHGIWGLYQPKNCKKCKKQFVEGDFLRVLQSCRNCRLRQRQ